MESEKETWRKILIGNKELANVKNPILNYSQKILPSIDLRQFPKRPKECVSLSVGDPTISFSFRTNTQNLQVFYENVGKIDGYTNMQGEETARESVLEKFNVKAYNLSRDDIYLTAGGTMAIWATMQLLAGKGDNFLFPSPGFPLALAIAKMMGLQARLYYLQADSEWSASIDEIELLIDDRTKFILINDPSNPLGASWSIEEKRKILDLSKRKRLPILLDEIYEGMLYSDMVPTFAELVEPQDADEITLFKCSGLTKRYFGPGWRMGWLILYASERLRNYYHPFLKEIFNMIQMPNTIVQASLPEILQNPHNETKISECMELMKQNQQTLKEGLKNESYCTFGYSAGALYATILLNLQKLNFEDSIDFSKNLYGAENVKIFPGEFFTGCLPFVRLVISCENAEIKEFLVRFIRFCRQNLKANE